MPCADMETTESKLSLVAEHAREDRLFRFTSRVHLLNADFLKRCISSLDRKKAVGHDGVSCDDYARNLDANIEDLLERLKRKSLQLHPEKSGRITFGRFELGNAMRQKRRPNTFDFLGFTHYCERNRRGGFTLGRKTSGKKFSATLKAMAGWLRDSRNLFTLKEWWIVLVSKMRGHIVPMARDTVVPWRTSFLQCARVPAYTQTRDTDTV